MEIVTHCWDALKTGVGFTLTANGLKIYEYLKHLLIEIPKHMDDTSLAFLDNLLPWSKNLPEECRKKT